MLIWAHTENSWDIKIWS